MHGFWIFWVVALVFWMSAARRRRNWRRWAMVGPGAWHPMYGPTYVLPDGRPAVPNAAAAPRRRQREEHDGEIEALETRIAELEQRLDFTERLLADRRKDAPAPS